MSSDVKNEYQWHYEKRILKFGIYSNCFIICQIQSNHFGFSFIKYIVRLVPNSESDLVFGYFRVTIRVTFLTSPYFLWMICKRCNEKIFCSSAHLELDICRIEWHGIFQSNCANMLTSLSIEEGQVKTKNVGKIKCIFYWISEFRLGFWQ